MDPLEVEHETVRQFGVHGVVSRAHRYIFERMQTACHVVVELLAPSVRLSERNVVVLDQLRTLGQEEAGLVVHIAGEHRRAEGAAHILSVHDQVPEGRLSRFTESDHNAVKVLLRSPAPVKCHELPGRAETDHRAGCQLRRTEDLHVPVAVVFLRDLQERRRDILGPGERYAGPARIDPVVLQRVPQRYGKRQILVSRIVKRIGGDPLPVFQSERAPRCPVQFDGPVSRDHGHSHFDRLIDLVGCLAFTEEDDGGFFLPQALLPHPYAVGIDPVYDREVPLHRQKDPEPLEALCSDRDHHRAGNGIKCAQMQDPADQGRDAALQHRRAGDRGHVIFAQEHADHGEGCPDQGQDPVPGRIGIPDPVDDAPSQYGRHHHERRQFYGVIRLQCHVGHQRRKKHDG